VGTGDKSPKCNKNDPAKIRRPPITDTNNDPRNNALDEALPCHDAYLILYEHYRWPAVAAEAIAGDGPGHYLWRESRCDPFPPPGQNLYCGGPCWGAFQWETQRWARMRAWMLARGLDPRSLEAQVHAAVAEWLELWPRASERFLRAGTPREALRVWDETFGVGGRDR
jgi:hypothetical protein